ncbi:YjdF family protein [Actinomyces oris]|uniref:YjdF family protein n=1 Tax=Actinomyces oris TaxID=544580 RepID=UPI00094D60AE|nr:YjdF family protein [Actinomyces oris]OLO70985.1 protein tyrosine kinase [Actinomyces oris]
MSNTPTPDRRTGVPDSISAQLTLFFDGRFWVGVLEHHELHHGGDAISRAITVRAARHVFGAEPSDAELYDFLLTHGGALIDRATACPPVPASRPVNSSSAPRPNPKRAARQAAKEAARARPSTAAQAALAAAREETATRASRDRSRRRRQKADEDWARRRQRAKRRHRGR